MLRLGLRERACVCVLLVLRRARETTNLLAEQSRGRRVAGAVHTSYQNRPLCLLGGQKTARQTPRPKSSNQTPKLNHRFPKVRALWLRFFVVVFFGLSNLIVCPVGRCSELSFRGTLYTLLQLGAPVQKKKTKEIESVTYHLYDLQDARDGDEVLRVELEPVQVGLRFGLRLARGWRGGRAGRRAVRRLHRHYRFGHHCSCLLLAGWSGCTWPPLENSLASGKPVDRIAVLSKKKQKTNGGFYF